MTQKDLQENVNKSFFQTMHEHEQPKNHQEGYRGETNAFLNILYHKLVSNLSPMTSANSSDSVGEVHNSRTAWTTFH